MKIIGITGTLGAGKGTVVDYLVEKKGFKHYSVRAYLIEEIKKRNLEINRNSMRIVANDLRERNGPAFIVLELYNQAFKNQQDCIIESIRCPGELDALELKEGFEFLAVDADSRIRYERILKRGTSTDNVTLEEFLEQEKAEMNNTQPFKQNLFECIRRAKYVIDNGSSIENLYKQIENIFS